MLYTFINKKKYFYNITKNFSNEIYCHNDSFPKNSAMIRKRTIRKKNYKKLKTTTLDITIIVNGTNMAWSHALCTNTGYGIGKIYRTSREFGRNAFLRHNNVYNRSAELCSIRFLSVVVRSYYRLNKNLE